MRFLHAWRRPISLAVFLASVSVLGISGEQASYLDSSLSADLPAANPGRPTVSTPETLAPAGYLQLEMGALGAEKSPEFANRTGFESLVKLSLTRRIELITQVEPQVISDRGTRKGMEPGEVFAGVQVVLKSGEGLSPTLAAGYFRRLYANPAPELDIGTNRQSALILASFDVRRFRIDTNAIVTEQISDQTGVRRGQFRQTLSIAHPVLGPLAISGELWRFSQPFLKSNAVGCFLLHLMPLIGCWSWMVVSKGDLHILVLARKYLPD